MASWYLVVFLIQEAAARFLCIALACLRTILGNRKEYIGRQRCRRWQGIKLSDLTFLLGVGWRSFMSVTPDATLLEVGDGEILRVCQGLKYLGTWIVSYNPNMVLLQMCLETWLTQGYIPGFYSKKSRSTHRASSLWSRLSVEIVLFIEGDLECWANEKCPEDKCLTLNAGWGRPILKNGYKYRFLRRFINSEHSKTNICV